MMIAVHGGIMSTSSQPLVPAATRVPISYSSPWDTRERQRRLSELVRAAYAGKRLAALRRGLTAALVLVGAPVIVLGRTSEGTTRRVLTVLGVIWLAMVLPMIRLLCAEWRNRRIMDDLQAILYGRR